MKMLGLLKIFISTVLILQYCVSADDVCGPIYLMPECSDIKPTLSNVFQTRIEITYVTEKRSASTRLFYDYDSRRAAIEIIEKDSYMKLIFNYETDELFEIYSDITAEPSKVKPLEGQPIYPSDCIASKLSDYKPNSIYDFGKVFSSDGLMSPKKPNELFKFYAERCNGSQIVNGIKTESYFDCQDFGNYFVAYYFTVGSENWSMPNVDKNYDYQPVRAIYTGIEKKSDGSFKPFEIRLDFYDFRTKIYDNTVFQTPSTVYCQNRKVSEPIPKLGSVVAFSEELIGDDQYEMNYIKDLYYDYNMKRIRYEMENSTQKDSTSTDSLIYISDYSLGVQYVKNKNLGSCLIRGIRYWGTDVGFENEQIDQVTQLKSPENFLNLDQDYIKIGTRLVNGFLSDKFIALKQPDKDIQQNVFYEYSFSNAKVNVSNEQSIEQSIPISLNLIIPEANGMIRTNFYNFYRGKQPMSLFDVSSCFDSKEIIQIKVTISYAEIFPSSDVLKFQKNLADNVLIQIAGNRDFSRFSEPLLSFNEVYGDIYAYLNILPRPPVMEMFTFLPSKFLNTNHIARYNNLTQVEQCATACIENARCLSFDWSLSFICYLYSEHYTTSSTFPSTNFEHYSRNSLNGSIVKESFQMYIDLEERIKNKELKLNITFYEGSWKELTFSKIEPYVTNNRQSTTSLLKNYRLKFKNSEFAEVPLDEFFQLSVDDCAKKCNELIGKECKSFNYCYLSSNCQLNTDLSGDQLNNSAIVQSNNCDIYEKDALFHYDSIPITTIISKQDVLYGEVSSASECASGCDKEKNIQCKSFNYCPHNKKCYLSKYHFVPSSSVESTDSKCDHYSRKFLSDFQYVSTQKVSLDAEIVLTGSSLEECSKECVTADGFKCKSFDYCNNNPVPTCLLNSGDKKINQQTGTHLKFDSCAHYKREYFFDTNLIVNTENGSSDFSESLILALSVLSLLVSLTSGAAFTIYLSRKGYFQ